MPLPFPVTLFSGTSFSPISLFSNGEQGVWFQNSDMSTLFRDAAGTTPVDGYEQFVGLRLDKSKGLVLGSELVANGDFSNGTTGWTAAAGNIAATITVVDGRGRVTNTSSAEGRAFQTFTGLTVGRFYLLTCDAYVGTATVSLGWTSNSNTTGGEAVSAATSGPLTLRVQATAATMYLRIVANTAGSGRYADFDNISVRELPGNHAYQTTTTARAVLSARYNQLTYTEQFDNAAWTAVGLVSRTKSGTAPDGISLWNVLTEDTGTSAHCVYGTSFAVTAGVIYTVSVYVNAGTRRYVSLRGFYSTTGNAWITFDTASPSINANAFVTNSGYESLGGGVYRIWLTSNVQTTKANDNIVIAGSNVSTAPAGGSATGNSYLGDGSTIIAWGADCRVANESSALPAYQRVGAAVNGTSTSIGTPDYDTVGFPAYLRYDGGDWYQTNSIDFSAGATNPPLGPELVANGDFSNGTTGWSPGAANSVLSVDAGRLKVLNGDASQASAYQSFPTVIGKTYKVQFTVIPNGTSPIVRLGVGIASAQYWSLAYASQSSVAFFFVATTTAAFFTLFTGSSTLNDSAFFDNLTVKELTDANYAPDKMSVFTGVRKLSDATSGMIVELATGISSPGTFFLRSPTAASGADYEFRSLGITLGAAISSSVFPAPITNILTGLGDISGDRATLRVDALQVAQSTADQNASNYGNYPLYIGARSGPLLAFTGREYETIVLGRAVTAAELTNSEGYIERQTFGKDMNYFYADELTTATGDLITAADGDQIYMTSTYS